MSKAEKFPKPDLSFSIRMAGDHSLDKSPLPTMEKTIAELFRLSGITGNLVGTVGPYLKQAKHPGISVLAVDARSVTLRVQVAEYHRFCYAIYIPKPAYLADNEQFADLLRVGIRKLKNLQSRAPRRRRLTEMIPVEYFAVDTLDLDEPDSEPEEEVAAAEELSEDAYQLSLLQAEHQSDEEMLVKVQTELTDAEFQIAQEKLKVPRDQELLRKLHDEKSRVIPWISSLRTRMSRRESEIAVLAKRVHLEQTREQRFQDAQQRVASVLAHGELAQFVEWLKGKA